MRRRLSWGALTFDMRVQFEFTQADLIDASKRFSARLKAVRSFQWTGLLATSFLTWLLVFVFLYRTPVQGAIIGLLAAAISAALFPGSNRRTVEKRMRKVSREIFGDTNSFLCEVELKPDGVWVRSMNRQTLFEWPSVEEIKETSDSVDIFTKEGSGVVVRNRAFTSPEERAEFIELARARLNSTHNTPAPGPPTANVNST
jgi:hypothetical protein